MDKIEAVEFRVAIFGLSKSGVSTFIAKATGKSDFKPKRTETEEESLVVRDNNFYFLWDMPQSCPAAKNPDQYILDFGGFVFMCDITTSEDINEAKEYLENLMSFKSLKSLPFLIIASKYDQVEDPDLYRPSQLMKYLTENLKKSHCIPVNSISGDGIEEFFQWVNSKAIQTNMS